MAEKRPAACTASILTFLMTVLEQVLRGARLGCCCAGMSPEVAQTGG